MTLRTPLHSFGVPYTAGLVVDIYSDPERRDRGRCKYYILRVVKPGGACIAVLTAATEAAVLCDNIRQRSGRYVPPGGYHEVLYGMQRYLRRMGSPGTTS